ncbi:MAG: electron transport complex subunit RsxA [Symbiobacteriaceae bacterium]|nr:electron transport complex subunit RsxA [Symbiobacteriaceae bacterium]
MSSLSSISALFLSGILVSNFVFVRFLGVPDMIASSPKTRTAVGAGIILTLLMTLASAVTWLLYGHLQAISELISLEILTFIIIILTLVYMTRFILSRLNPVLHKEYVSYMPALSTNSIILGATLINARESTSFLQAIASGFAMGMGVLFAFIIFSSVQQRLIYTKPPRALEGLPIFLISAGLISLVFSGFDGLFQLFIPR